MWENYWQFQSYVGTRPMKGSDVIYNLYVNWIQLGKEVQITYLWLKNSWRNANDECSITDVVTYNQQHIY